jgi:hypothetical protein
MGEQVQIARCVLLLCAVFTGNVFAADPWGTTWGESFNSVKAKYPEAEVLDTSKADYCMGSKIESCQKRQVEVRRTIAGSLPARAIFVFTPDAKLSSVLVSLIEPEKYSPSRLGTAYIQLQNLLEMEYGKAVGANSFVVRPDPNRFNKNSMGGKANSIWHTKDSIVSLDVFAFGTDAEDKQTNTSGLFITYSPLRLIGK